MNRSHTGITRHLISYNRTLKMSGCIAPQGKQIPTALAEDLQSEAFPHRAFSLAGGIVLIVVFSFVSCETTNTTLERTKKQLSKVQEDYEAYKKEAAQELETIKEVNETIYKTKEAVSEAKETYNDAKKKTKDTVQKTKRKVVKIARRMPRSRDEANKMVIDNGRSLSEWFQENLKTFSMNNSEGLIQQRNNKIKPRAKK